MAKRLFDLLAAGLGLLSLLPLFAGIALWIKLDSTGPVFFRQARVGWRGKVFYIHKFRTMRTDAEKIGLQITVGQDPRITRSGAFLRATKLDELPQLIDVVLGRMSLVGPRPEVPAYVAMYTAEVRTRVLSVRPGITDLASIEYRHENALLGQATDPEHTYIHEVMPAKLGYNLQYVDNHTLPGDIAIIFRTLRALFR